MIMKYSKQERDQIANLMVLSYKENCDEKRATHAILRNEKS